MNSGKESKGNKNKQFVTKICVAIALIILVSLFVVCKSALGGYRLDWTEVSKIEKNGVRVEARFASHETAFSLFLPTPPILSVLVLEPWYGLHWNKELVRIKNGDNKANQVLSEDSILFVSTYQHPRDLFKLYFLTNVSNYVEKTLIINKKDELRFHEPTGIVTNEWFRATVRNVSNLSKAINVTFTSLKFESNVGTKRELLEIGEHTIIRESLAPGYYERNLLVLGVDSITVSFPEPEIVKLNIGWSNGQITEDYCLSNPRDNREFMDVCGN